MEREGCVCASLMMSPDAQSWLKNHTGLLGTHINNPMTERLGGFRATSETARGDFASICIHV